MIRDVTLSNLGEMSGGAVSVQFQRHLARAFADCEDRPGDKTARKIVLEIEVVPVVDQLAGDGLPAVIHADITCKIKSKMPDHVSKPTECHLRQGNRAVFNDMSESNVSQMTLDEAQEN